MKYEGTGETTYEPAVAVGWGVWRDEEGNVLRVDGRVLQVLRGRWMRTRSFGIGRLERMRVVHEPRSGAELRRWLVAHPGVEVAQNSARRRWSHVEARFEETSSDSWYMAPDEWVWSMAPADGEGWDR